MSDIFLSYASVDRERIKPLVDILQTQGFSVWWDNHIGIGNAFDKKIEAEVESAKCVLVVWSEAALNSDWVRAEANEALERRTIVPLIIDDIAPPLAFRTIQTSKLIGWPTTRSAADLNNVISAIKEKIGGTATVERIIVDATDLISDKSIAILPFRSLSPNPDDSYFAEGLTDEILNVLSRIPDLNVASRTSSAQFRDGLGGDSRSIGTQLNVGYLLEGSVRKAGQRLRVSVQLVQAIDGYTLWSKTYNDTMEDVFSLQDEIAGRVANALKSTLWESILEHQARNRTDNTRAYDEYLLAMHYDREMHQGGHESLDLVRKHAENAVEIDPEFVPAWILLADVYLNRMGYRMTLAEAHPLAKNALQHATALDPLNPEVLLQLAELARGDHQYDEARNLYKKARELDRVSPQVDYATLLFTIGELPSALQEFEHCIEKDPENFSLWYYYGATLFGAGKIDDAITYYEKALAIAGAGFLSDGVRATLAGTLFLAGKTELANAMLAPCLQANPNRIDFEVGLIACIEAMLGNKDNASKTATLLEAKIDTEHVDPQAMFWLYFGLEDIEKSFYWMRRIVEEDSFPTIYFFKTWPLLEPLRQYPEYNQLLTEAGIILQSNNTKM